jgi:hypothetical protein
MKTFLDDPMTANFEAANSTLAQHAKAAALFERASHIGGNRTGAIQTYMFGCQWNICSHVSRSFGSGRIRPGYILFEHGLNQVVLTLPSSSFNIIPTSIDTIQQRLVNFTLCEVAIIQLHSTFDNPASIHKCLSVVRYVVSSSQHIPCDLNCLMLFDPMIGA